mgnify:CR=1 FL=1
MEDDARAAQTLSWIDGYLELQDGSNDINFAVGQSLPFVENGALHLHVESFVKHLDISLRQKIATKEVRARFSEIGMKGKKISVRSKKSKMTSRYYWIYEAWSKNDGTPYGN